MNWSIEVYMWLLFIINSFIRFSIFILAQWFCSRSHQQEPFQCNCWMSRQPARGRWRLCLWQTASIHWNPRQESEHCVIGQLVWRAPVALLRFPFLQGTDSHSRKLQYFHYLLYARCLIMLLIFSSLIMLNYLKCFQDNMIFGKISFF